MSEERRWIHSVKQLISKIRETSREKQVFFERKKDEDDQRRLEDSEERSFPSLENARNLVLFLRKQRLH